MSNFPHSNVQNGSSFNRLNTLQKLIDSDSNVSINDEIKYQNHMSEEISYHQNSEEIIYHACDDSGINLVNIKKEMGFTCIHSTN